MHCPFCKKEFKQSETTAMPFCSDRCKTIDLGRWLDEGYSVPHAADPDEEEEPAGGF